MKNPLPRLLRPLAVALLFSSTLCAQTPAAPKVEFPRPSPLATLQQRVGFTDIEIVYSRPGVKGRKIFADAASLPLQPFGEIWRAGANDATKVTFSTPVKINGTELPAGSYGLFVIPGQDEFTVILNKIVKQWGAYKYDPKDDVLRVAVKPIALTEPVETLTIDINDIRDDSATLNIVWEKTRVPVKFEVDVLDRVVPQIEAAMASGAKLPLGVYQQAADFYLDHNLDLAKAAGWMDVAIAQRPEAYFLHYHKARILAKMGDKAGATAAARKSIELAAADKGNPLASTEYQRLNEKLIASLQ